MTKNYYTILGVQPHASQEEIRQAYEKALAKAGLRQSKETMVEVEEAYFVLSDPDSRLHYDNIYKISSDLLGNFDGLDLSRVSKNLENLNVGDESFDGPEFLEDLLETMGDIFGEITNPPRLKGAKKIFEKPVLAKNNIYLDLRLSPQEAVSGGYKEIEYQSYIKCSDCAGLGSKNSVDLVPCVVCANRPASEIELAFGKQGQVPRGIADKTGLGSFKRGNFGIGTGCSVCAGLGKYPEVNCLKCKGQGRVLALKKAEILVPPKVKNGTILKIAKQGHYGFRSLPNGDLILKVMIKS